MSAEFIVRLRPEPGIDGLRALQSLLKAALRRYGLKAVRIERIEPGE